MAYAHVTYTGDGATTEFDVPYPYISPNYVHVAVDRKRVDFTWLGTTTVKTLTTPPDGSQVKVYRSTPATTKLVDFNDAAILTESDLDTAFDQTFHISQETLDTAGEVLQVGVKAQEAATEAQAFQAQAQEAATEARSVLDQVAPAPPPPNATTTQRGIVRRATDTEATAGVNADTAITPSFASVHASRY